MSEDKAAPPPESAEPDKPEPPKEQPKAEKPHKPEPPAQKEEPEISPVSLDKPHPEAQAIKTKGRRKRTYTRTPVAHYRQRQVLPWELPSVMRKHIYTGAMGGVYFYSVTGVFFVYFARQVGASVFQLGLLSFFASVALSLQIFSAHFVQKMGKRKLLWFICGLLERSFRTIAFVVAFFMVGNAEFAVYAPVALIALLMVGSLFGAMALPPWLSWLADLIPPEQHSSFWGRRSAWLAGITALIVLPFGYFIDVAPEELKLNVLMAIFIIGILFGFMDIIIHRTIPEPFMAPVKRRPFLQELVAPLKNWGFRRWLIFISFWNFGMMLTTPVVFVHWVENLQLSRTFLGLTFVSVALPLFGTLVTGRILGRWIDTVGIRRSLLISHLFWAVMPLMWFFATPQAAMLMIGISSVIGGAFADSGTNAATKLITRLPPPGERTMYIAVSSCLGSLAAALGALTGGWIGEIFIDVSHYWRGVELTGFHIVFMLSFLLRVGGSFISLIVPEPPGSSARQPQ